MRLKLDENLGRRCIEVLQAAGHDVATVASQAMTSSGDRELIDTCAREKRALVTLDLDFSNPLIFPPRQYHGIAVLRLPAKPTYAHLLAAVRTFADALTREELEGKLWSVKPAASASINRRRAKTTTIDFVTPPAGGTVRGLRGAS